MAVKQKREAEKVVREFRVDGKTVSFEGRIHGNGGGFAAAGADVEKSAYVGPKAAVLGGKVSGNARIEDEARVFGGNVGGNAVVRDKARVFGGWVCEDAVVGGTAHLVEGTLAGKFVLEGDAVFMYKDEVANVGRVRTGRVLDCCSYGTYLEIYMY